MDLTILLFDGDFEEIKETTSYKNLDAKETKEIISQKIQLKHSYHLSIYKETHYELNLLIGKNGTSLFRNLDDMDTENAIHIDSFQEALQVAYRFIGSKGSGDIDDYIHQKKQAQITEKEEKLDAWRKRHKANEKKEKKAFYQRLLILLGVIAMIWITFRLIWTGEIYFIGRNTETLDAVVVKAEYYKESGRFTYQKVIYEYLFEDQLYQGHFKANKFTGAHSVGDSIVVKIRVSEPHFSKHIGWK